MNIYTISIANTQIATVYPAPGLPEQKNRTRWSETQTVRDFIHIHMHTDTHIHTQKHTDTHTHTQLHPYTYTKTSRPT